MSTARYKNYKSNNIKNAQPGYAPNAFLTPISWLDTEADVVGNAAAGDRVTIDSSHVWTTDHGAIQVYCVPGTNEGDADVVGETLAKRYAHKPKLIIAGDSAELLDMALGILNESFILHSKDSECNALGYVQHGCGCDPCIVNTGSFKSGKLSDGRKQYEFELLTYHKYFYNGILTVIDDAADILATE